MKVTFMTGLYLQDIDRKTYVPWLDAESDKFRIDKDFSIAYDGEIITVPAGYITDLSSVPRFLWSFYPPASSFGRKPSVVHDYIYSTLYTQYTKKYADKMYYEGIVSMGMPKWKAKVCYSMVRLFGRGGWHRKQSD